jgi:hypothetical protein
LVNTAPAEASGTSCDKWHRRLAAAIAVSETQLKQLQADKARLPERINVAGLSDYRSFNAIDNEGKNLFDFVTSSVWNVRRQLLD